MRSRLVLVMYAAVVPLAVACGGGTTSSSTSTVVLSPATNYSTVPTTPTTITTTTLPGQTVVGAATTYTITASDTSRLRVANKFGITVDALDAANVATPGYSQFYPGLVIQIPAGGTTVPGATQTTVATGGTTGATVAAQTTIAVDACAAGSYTITADDTSRLKVANKFNVTVEALDAANANTAGYSAFFAGLKIVIPPKAGCA